jgi:hypothetical protein
LHFAVHRFAQATYAGLAYSKKGRCLYDVGGASLAFATGSDLLFGISGCIRGVHPVVLQKKNLHTPLLAIDIVVTDPWAAVCHAAHTSL